MRRVIAGAFVSLDGVMQAPGGPEEDHTPAGSVKTGSFALSTPTEAELVRRERMKQEG